MSWTATFPSYGASSNHHFHQRDGKPSRIVREDEVEKKKTGRRGCVPRVQKSLSWHAAAAAAVMIKCMASFYATKPSALGAAARSEFSHVSRIADSSRRWVALTCGDRVEKEVTKGENNWFEVLLSTWRLWLADLNARTRREPQQRDCLRSVRAVWHRNERTRARDCEMWERWLGRNGLSKYWST